jgi:hypothetical protein
VQKWFLILVFFSSFVLNGCSRAPLLVDRVLVKNASDGKVTEVKIHHEPTNRIGSVNAILPQESLDIGFPDQPLLARQAIIQWRDSTARIESVRLLSLMTLMRLKMDV